MPPKSLAFPRSPHRVLSTRPTKFLHAVERTGYVPNMLAGALASSHSRLVAALVPTIAGPVFLETVQALIEVLAESGYQLMLGQSGYSDAREDALLNAIIGRRPDGTPRRKVWGKCGGYVDHSQGRNSAV